MEYKGKLYGKVDNHYFPLIESTTDIEKLKEKVKELEDLYSLLLPSFMR